MKREGSKCGTGLVAAAIVGFGIFLAPPAVRAEPLDNWKISCKVDKGAIVKKGDVRTFKTSKNYCEGGVFNQRAEIFTDHVRPTHKGTYLFESYVAMKTKFSQQYTIFSLHDARMGCAPPLSIDVTMDGSLLLKSDIKTGEGESCIRGTLDEKLSAAKLKRDGTEQKLSILVAFDGKAGFDVKVSIDDVEQLSGTYDQSKQPKQYRSKKFYFKHGVYSQDMFEYEMTSRAMTVVKLNP